MKSWREIGGREIQKARRRNENKVDEYK